MRPVSHTVAAPGSSARAARWPILLALVAALAGIFLAAVMLPESLPLPPLFTIFNSLIVLGALPAIAFGWRRLRRRDWAIALAVGVLLGAQLPLSRYIPAWNTGQTLATGFLHGVALMLVLLGGLAAARHGGPVRSALAEAGGRRALRSAGLGIVMGLPLAIVNVLAFTIMQGRGIQWQNVLAAGMNALQPAIVEEAFYRLAMLSFLALLLRPAWPRHAPLLAASLSLLAHNYSHFGPLLREQPLFALGYGAVVGLVFGLPMTVLALRRDVEAAVGCHWVVDFLRFAAGF